jgi:hypothetical protein
MKILPVFVFCSLMLGLASGVVFAQKAYPVTGTVDSVDSEFAKIKVAGKTYRLARAVSVHDEIRLREIPPTINDIKKGDSVGLIFASSSKKSSVEEIWLLNEFRQSE